MSTVKVLTTETRAKAVKLALVWCREFSINDVPDWGNPYNEYMLTYGKESDRFQIVVRRSFTGFWVELFKDGFTIRSVNVI